MMLFTFTILLLAGIAGHFARLSPGLDVRFSGISLAIATVIGAASWGATVERPITESSSSGRNHPGEAGKP